MAASPFGFLRGSAKLFFEILRQFPELGQGPGGEGVVVGDLHMANFGAYEIDVGREHRLVFGLNDFDEAEVAPHRFDVLRALTSIFLARHELALSMRDALGFGEAFLRGYLTPLPRRPPAVVMALLARAAERSTDDLLSSRLTRRGSFRYGLRYQPLSGAILKILPAVLERFRLGLDAATRPAAQCFVPRAAAFRIAGTGSVGRFRMAVLCTGKRAPWLLDLKAQPSRGAPAERDTGGSLSGAARVLDAVTRCLEGRPRLAGTSAIAGTSLYVRRLTPEEDKLDLAQLRRKDLAELFPYLGAITGIAHRRGQTSKGKLQPWAPRAREKALAQAAELAALHEGIFALWSAEAPPDEATA